MTSLEHLLPAPDQTVRCVDHSRSLAVDPGGSAIRADRVILVETPLPWPKPVFAHPALVEINPILKQSTRPTRTLAYVPTTSGSEVGLPTVISFDRDATGAGVTERRYQPTSPAQLLELAQMLADDNLEGLDAQADSVGQMVSPVVLICTQGSHDVCCGSEGARFAAEAELIDGLTVFRVSHTGGHRFAPTAMTLPDGRMWSDMDLDLLRQILARTGNAADVIDRCRGWWGAGTGPAQMAERAVFETVGWELENHGRSIAVGESHDDGAVTVSVSIPDADADAGLGGRSWMVTVAPGRTVPTIACRQPGGLPAKPSVEYRIDRLDES